MTDSLHFRYGWDDPYEYDESGAYEYEGWFQDPETGQWKLDPAVREYYEKLGITIPDPDTDNETSASNKPPGRVDNSKTKEVREVSSDNKNVSELNKRNTDRLSSVSSDNYFIPYGDKSRTQEPSEIVNNKGQKEKTKAKTDHATKTMHPMLQGNLILNSPIIWPINLRSLDVMLT